MIFQMCAGTFIVIPTMPDMKHAILCIWPNGSRGATCITSYDLSGWLRIKQQSIISRHVIYWGSPARTTWTPAFSLWLWISLPCPCPFRVMWIIRDSCHWTLNTPDFNIQLLRSYYIRTLNFWLPSKLSFILGDGHCHLISHITCSARWPVLK